MFNHHLKIYNSYLTSLLLILIIITIPMVSYSQPAMVNNGANITVVGPGSQAGNVGIAVLGNYLNTTDGVSDGKIELAGGHILVTGDWTNNANNNVFTNFTGTKQDGFVTLFHQSNPQIIGGPSSTHFENLVVKRSRKSLTVDNCSVDGTLFVDAPFILNANTFVINNPSPAGINYQSGFIKSETLPAAYSIIRWRIGSATASYNIPFGSDNLAANNDLNFGIDILTPMNDSDFIDFATYPTDFYNYPLPTNASPLETEPKKVVDRFWITKSSNFMSRPDVNLIFTYSSNDISPAYNTLNLQELKASRNNTSLGKWLDMPPIGTSVSNQVYANGISSSDFYDSWVLLNVPGPLTDLFTADAFTPNGDGLNDNFLPVFQVDFEVIKYDFYIYNRWGQLMFHTTDENIGWNGVKTGSGDEPVIDVYSWVIVVKGKNKYNTEAEGETKKYVGRVTLIK